MTTVEKIILAKSNKQFTLFKEGVFYKCYNEDAMLFIKRVKEYKVNSKFIKSAGSVVHSIGFPVSETEKENLSFEIICEKISAENFEKKNENVVFLINDFEIKNDYEVWEQSIQTSANKVVNHTNESYDRTIQLENIATMISNYDLANNTPMQGLSFIQDLKIKIQKIE